jgi:hypothetical protein
MRPTVYVETTIISYLTAWPSRDIIRLAQQQRTRDWWDSQLPRFNVVCSELVLLECAAGDQVAAADRLGVLAPLPILRITESATMVAEALLVAGAIPRVAARDAAHVGICAVHQIPFLLTWNFKHLANAQMQDNIREVCSAQGHPAPVICTPEELFED